MRPPRIQWTDADNNVRRQEILDRVFIGRRCSGIDPKKRIIVDEPLVSRDHAVISRRAGALSLLDSSKNGTWINGTRVAPGSTRDLLDGDQIRIGECSFLVICSPDDSAGDTCAAGLDSTVVGSAQADVTCLAADIREFSKFSQSHTSRQVYVLIKEIFEKFSDVVGDFKGTIKDFAGDAVFAYWDHQVSNPEAQAVLACRAATQQMSMLRRILAELSADLGGLENLQMGWGLATGAVTISHFGSRPADMAVVGDCINLGFRLSTMANKYQTEEILLCAKTAALVQNDFTLSYLGRIPVRGRRDKESVFALTE
jgi:class 3 adenylate cyclase